MRESLGCLLFLANNSRMARRKTKRSKKARRTRRRIRGGDYRQYTNQTILGLPLSTSATYAAASGVLSLQEYKALMERKGIDPRSNAV